MAHRRHSLFSTAVAVLLALTWGTGRADAKPPDKPLKLKGKITAKERKEAAARARALGMLPGVAGLTGTKGRSAGVLSAGATRTALATTALPPWADPGGVPHYFGPFGNWAYSPVPAGPILSVAVDAGGAGYTAPVVNILDAYGTGTGATATATLIGDAIGTISVTSAGTGYSAPVVQIVDPTGTGAAASAFLDPALVTGGIRKFVDQLPGLGLAAANGLGQYIPVAVPENFATPSLPSSDHYVIGLVEFNEKMHTDLPPTLHRGYVQLETPANAASSKHVALRSADGLTAVTYPDGTQVYAVDDPHFLGPVIVAQRDKPVRITFHNLLPIGSGGDLFLPVDTTVMGSGNGPMMAGMPGMQPEAYTQNRATVHLHGNNTVWISDGTTHQWITPAGEATMYPKGVSARNVPDMPDPGPGAATFFYTNAQSARLMFYHDHAMGITRLNVYAGEAAGYLVTDQVETDLVAGTNVTGVNPGGLKVLPDLGIPLVIQDRTWVDAATIGAQDPTWNSGTAPRDPVTGKITGYNTGDLWYPHVYLSAQNPWDLSGVNAIGRWHYGPWFWPPVQNIAQGPVANPYYQPDCDLVPPGPGCTAPWEPPLQPGVPSLSMAGEAFMDTPVVNGTAYPYLTVEPKAYRFRILNAADDRMFNLQLYVAADKTTPTTAGATGTVLCDTAGGVVDNCTEVKMVSQAGLPNQLADWPSGVPDPLTKGPDWIQIGTEGGFLPAPVLIPSQPIGWNLNPTTFNYGNVNQRSLLLGTAERADVIVDFSAYAGKTLILYNDAPAAFPAGVPSYDFFTGVASQLESGGAPSTLPGFGPNTRTVMQIRVGTAVTTPTPDVTLANLEAVFAKTATKRGAFEVSQEPILVPQAAYGSAYNRADFPATAAKQYVQFHDTSKTFTQLNADGTSGAAFTLGLEPKAMHDEMGGVYDVQFGRMSGMLGLDNPNPTSTAANFLAYPYGGPPVDVIKATDALSTQIGTLRDGTQIWKITHNGVDTHTIHTHLFNAQLVNRVAMDGVMLPPEPNELGWKDTFRVNPLEHTILALRPVPPTPAQVPFDIPNSVRLIDPTMAEGELLPEPPPAGWFDPAGNGINGMVNHYVNFGAEYVYHCHILAHEEMDMMHAIAFAIPPKAPSGLAAVIAGSGNKQRIDLTWTDASANETSFRVERSTGAAGPWTLVATVAENSIAYSDTSVNFKSSPAYYYRLFATNTVGDTAAYPAPSIGFPNVSVDSDPTAVVAVGTPAVTGPAAPTALTATLQAGPRIALSFKDNSSNETSFKLERDVNGTGFVPLATLAAASGTKTVTTSDATVVAGNTYTYRVAASNAAGDSAWAVSAAVAIAAPPLAPASLTATAVRSGGKNAQITLTWPDVAGETGYTIQQCLEPTFMSGVVTTNVAANATSWTSGSVSRLTSYYFRNRASNAAGTSGWTNALPFPIVTP